MKPLKQLKKLLLMLLLITVGAQSAWADSQYVYAGTRTEGNLTFAIYHHYGVVNAIYTIQHTDIAVLTGITGTAEEVTIPAYLEESGLMFGLPVQYANGTITNSYVKTLTFAGSISFFGHLEGYEQQQAPDVEIEGHLSCSNLNTIIFKGNDDGSGLFKYETETTTAAPLQCSNLTDIYFQASSAPPFESKFVLDYSGGTFNSYTIPVTWEQICTAPGSNVTAHVAAWTQEECDQRHQSSNVYKQLKNVVHYKEGENLVTVTASVTGGALFQAEDFGELSGDMIKSKDIDKSNSLTFYVYSSSNDIVVEHVYVNDTDVKDQMTTTTDGKKKYTLEGEVMQDDVVIRVVGAEKVNVMVTVSQGVGARANGLGDIYNGTTKTIKVNKGSRFIIFPYAANNNYEVGHVYVNGKAVTLETLQDNTLRYIFEELNQEVYINVVGEAKNLYANVSANADGSVAWDSYTITNNSTIATLPKTGGTEFTLTPNSGYELDKCWLRGFDVTTQYPGSLVSNADGTYTFTLPALDVDETTLAVTFKKASESLWTIHLLDGIEGVKMAFTSINSAHGENDITNAYGNHYIPKTSTDTYQLKVPVDENGRPVRVVRNGEDITYEYDDYDSSNGYLCYNMNVQQDANWEISYDISHRQTIYRKGGTGVVELGYGYLSEEYTPAINNGMTTVDFPAYNANKSNYAEFSIEYVAGEKVKIYRNGDDVTSAFGEPQTFGGSKYYYYISDYSTGPNTQNAYGFILRDPATWEITIEESHKMLNSYANKDVSITFMNMVDGEAQSSVSRDNALRAWVNEGETYVVKFTPKPGEELTRFDINWKQIDIENESRLVKNDDGSYSFTITYDEINAKPFDIMAVFSGGTTTGRNIFVKTNSKEYTDVFIGDNVSACFMGTRMFEVPEGTTIQLRPYVQRDMVKKVKLNGDDVTNNETYLRQKEETMGDRKYWEYDFSSVVGDAFIDIIYVNPQYDTNEDGNVNVTDVTKLVNKILGRE